MALTKDLFKTGVLTSLVRNFTYNDSITSELFTSKTAEGEFYEFEVVSGSTDKTDFRGNASPAGTSDGITRKRVEVKLAHLREKRDLPAWVTKLVDAPGSKSTFQRVRSAINDEQADLFDVFSRTWEWLRWQLLTTGGVTITLEGATRVYDFDMLAAHKPTAGTLWSTAATATPIADLKTWKKLIRRNGGVSPTKLYISDTALVAAMKCVDTLAIISEVEKNQYTATGMIPKLAGLEVIMVDHGYKSGATFHPYLSSDGTSEDMVLIKADGPVGEFAEGPPIDHEAPDELRGMFSKSILEADPSIYWILLDQLAMCGLTMPDKIVAATVL